MKINYFGYCFTHEATSRRVLLDIRPFLKAFCRLDAVQFKNNFRYQDENLYLIRQTDDVYLFLTTRSNELIRKINTENITIGEINALLGDAEAIGFASYIIIKEHFIGFGATQLAPKVDVFSLFMNNLLESLGIVDWKFLPQAFMKSATKEEAMNMPFIGKTTIEISRENSFFQDILHTVSVDPSDTFDLESFEITIKPRSRRNIKTTVNKFLDRIPDAGMQKLIVKAKEEGMSQLLDLYLVGSGAICDYVDKKQEPRIIANMQSKIESNRYLREKVEDYTSDENFSQIDIDVIIRFNSDNTWTTFIRNLHESDIVE